MSELELVRPAYRTVPDWSYTEGPGVVDLCNGVGYGPDGNQGDVLDAIFAEDKHGRPAAREIAIICTRQNLKTAILKMAFFGWLFLLQLRRPLVYTAHEWNPACAEMLKDMKEIIGGSPALSKRVRRIYEGNGEESIETKSGARMLFKTRTKDNIRSLAAEKVALDEGFALQQTHMGSIGPTISTRLQGQIIIGSSHGKAESEVLRTYRDRGRAGGDPFLAYFEWCMPDPVEACARGEQCDHGRRTPGCGLDKPELLQRSNPAAGIVRADGNGLTMNAVLAERLTMSPGEYGRERGGWWDPPIVVKAERPPLSIDRWEELVDDDVDQVPEIRCYAIDTDLDLIWTSVGGAAKRDDGRIHLEHIGRGRTDEGTIALCLELHDECGAAVFAIDRGGPAKPLIQKLIDAGLQVEEMDLDNVVEACGDLVKGVNTPDSVKYVHGPQSELDTAIIGARKRPLNERGFAFGRRKSDADITPLNAVCFAAWLCGHLDYNVLDSGY